jgi:PAS domain S-box-containing protein
MAGKHFQLGAEHAAAAAQRRATLVGRLQRLTRWAIALAAALGAASLVASVVGAGALSPFAPAWPISTPATSVAILALCAIFWLLLTGNPVRRRAAYLALALSALSVLAMAVVAPAWVPGGPVSAYPAGVIVLLATGIALAAGAGETQTAAARLLAAVAAALAFAALIGTAFRLLLGLPAFVPASLPTLIALILLSLAVMVCRQDAWLLTRLTSTRPGAVMVRRLLPAILLLPLIIAWAQLAAENAGLVDLALGAVLGTMATMFAVGALVLWGAQMLDRLDARRTAAERQAHAQREWLRTTIASCSEAIVATNASGTVRLVNRAAEALAGRRARELVGTPVNEAFALFSSAGEMEHPVMRVLSAGTTTAGWQDLSLLQESGTREVEVSVAPIHSEDGLLLGAVMVLRDVSARRQSEQALRRAYAELDQRVAERTAELERANRALHESLALLRGVAESTPDLIVVKDREGRVVMSNPAHAKTVGKPESEVVGHTDNEFMADAELAKLVMDNDRRVMSSGRVERVEEIVPVAEGVRTFLATKSPLRDVHDEVIGVISVATDISERKRMENELREAQRFTQGLVETAPIILYLFDRAQNRIVYASGMGLQALGYTPADLVGHDRGGLESLVHPDDLPALVDRLRREPFDQPIREAEFRCRSRSGEWRWMHAREREFEPGEPGEGDRLVLGITIDVTERKRAELERERLMQVEQRLRQEAESANRAKDEFLAIVSHELRSPLNALRGWGFLLGSAKTVDASLIERATQAIKRNVDHQARLIDDLLDTSRIMSGKLTLERRPLDFVEVVQTALETVRPSAQAKRITLEFSTGEPHVTLEGDTARLQQIAVNLLTNAVKFTPEEGKVTARIDLAQDVVRLSVTDTGAGIDPEFLPRVFDRFTQADTSTTRRYGGLGIGLALVRHLAELHGGRVSADSAGHDKGSTFVVELPLPGEGAHPDAAGLPPEENVRPGSPLSGTRVCALDDDPDARDVISLTLRQAGADVRTVSSGAELIAVLDNQLPARRPDVLLMDLAMPDEDGFTVLAKVRELEKRKAVPPEQSIPAIAVTAFTEVNRSRVVERGFVDHVSKPIDPERLVASVRRAVSG